MMSTAEVAKMKRTSALRIQCYQDQIAAMLAKYKKNGILLQSTWTLYVDQRPDSGSCLADYTSNLRKIYTFSTIEEFWNVFESIPSTSDLPVKCSYHLMRGTRRPIWEDPENVNGGYWTFKNSKRNSAAIWKSLVLAAISEQFQNSIAADDSIVGVTFGSREKCDHFQVWNENCYRSNNAQVIEKVTQELVPISWFHAIYYKEHQRHNDFNNFSQTSSFNYHKNFEHNQQFTKTYYERPFQGSGGSTTPNSNPNCSSPVVNGWETRSGGQSPSFRKW